MLIGFFIVEELVLNMSSAPLDAVTALRRLRIVVFNFVCFFIIFFLVQVIGFPSEYLNSGEHQNYATENREKASPGVRLRLIQEH